MAPKPAKKPPAKAKAQPNRFIGSGFDEFLEQEGILAEVDAVAIRRVIVWELSRAMKAKGVSKSRLATLMGTSRTQIDRLLDADENVTIEAVSRAAAALGLQLTVSLT
jgi:DNA-binding phage protein